MLIFVLLLLIRTAVTLPTALSTAASDSIPQAGSSDATRSTSEIVWSCITTIFACTWVAVHPNVPFIHASNRELLWRRAKILAVALIAPEFVIIWAANQLRSAFHAVRTLREFDACQHWTMTHGMFLVMGGFMLTDASGKISQVLQEKNLAHLLFQGDIVLPHISESEIMDRSKGDALAKTLVLIQTTWFIAQVISRAVLHLPITELELTTVAFALLNFFTYALWWKKPLDVRYPILVALLPTHESEVIFRRQRSEPEGENVDRDDTISQGSTDWVSWFSSELAQFQNLRTHFYSQVTEEVHTMNINSRRIDGDTEGGSYSCSQSPAEAPDKNNTDNFQRVSSSLTSTSLSSAPEVGLQAHSAISDWEEGREPFLSKASSFITSVWAYFLGLFRGFIMPAPNLSSDEDHRYTNNVPLFYAGPRRPVLLETASRFSFYFGSMVLEMFIGTLFGSIHCAAWAFHFPSKLERDLWRTMSLCITVAPLAMIFGVIPVFINRYLYLTRITRWLFVVYILARLMILVMAFVLLRDLPEAAFQEIQWTTYIPHV
ncbi:hypothetical protein GYMLUDRAFT_437380 [Collybiopsis luxurians FD-317 M1]|uniref:Uncharacterized protein n=1 Tax=Collybiopsis luxurians FD-317 M1 TaxID=944289 RepID=A0A0D0CWK3_9AGAR|nr:hypothetical protein GYMLUDRAFT_437380 [Collybiopsis luxurians FD-317 M1]